MILPVFLLTVTLLCSLTAFLGSLHLCHRSYQQLVQGSGCLPRQVLAVWMVELARVLPQGPRKAPAVLRVHLLPATVHSQPPCRLRRAGMY